MMTINDFHSSQDADLNTVIQHSTVSILAGRYAMVKVISVSEKTKYFMKSDDGEEITLVIEEQNLADNDYIDIQKWFKLIQIAVAIPFFAIGFLASITSAIAMININVLVISTFSNDYLLIREHDISHVLIALEKLGFPIVEKASLPIEEVWNLEP